MVAYRGGAPIRASRFLTDVRRIAPALGAARCVLNACADRYHFAVGLAACLTTRRVSLLPATHTPAVIRQLAHSVPGVVCLTDEPECAIELPRVSFPVLSSPCAGHDPAAAGPVPAIDAGQLVARVFTSGSTGAPLPHRKSWGPLVACVREAAVRLGLDAAASWAIVATVPPQHMYGFESSVLLALVNGHALCAERPFYPADIAAVLAGVPRPRLLVSTPVHLRALSCSGIALPPVDLIVSATAPLAEALASDVEQRYRTRLLEIYGSTETGQIAVRRPTHSREWRLWPGVTLSEHDGATWAVGGHVETPIRMCDVLEMTGAGRFLLHGRTADLVNIAGKRSSLAYLDHEINSIPGVVDGAFFHVEESSRRHTGIARMGACVVAPELTAARLLAELRRRIDAVFLPRPLLFVARLPRNSTGKLPQEALRALAARHRLAARQARSATRA